MAGSVNKVILIGNLGKDPEVRSMQSGSKVCNLSVATSESWKDKATGERKEKTEWHRVVVFNENIINVCEKYLKKGAKIYLEGQIETRKWQDAQGADKYSTEIVLRPYRGELTMLSGRDESGGGSYNEEPAVPREFVGAGSSSNQGAVYTPSGPAHDLDDEIPF